MQISKAGVALLLAFVASQAVRDVHLGHLFGSLGLFEAALLAFGTAAVLFGAGLLVFRREQIDLLIANRTTVLLLNVTTMIAWMSYFGSLRLVEPAAANLAFAGVAPVAVAVFAGLGLSSGNEKVPSLLERSVHAALLGVVVLLAVIVSTGQSGFAGIDPLTGLAGVGLACLAGVSITAESIYAKRMNERGVSPLAIVGTRFILVTLVAGVMVMRELSPYAGYSPETLAGQALVFLAILIGPIYLAQAGLARTSPLVSGTILAVGPVATLALQSIAGGIALAPAMMLVTLLYALASIVTALLSARMTGRSDPSQAAPASSEGRKG
jgi:hypothetical protein